MATSTRFVRDCAFGQRDLDELANRDVGGFPVRLGRGNLLERYASANLRNTLKPILENLGRGARRRLWILRHSIHDPLLRGLLGSNTVEIYDVASAGIVIGIMIIPPCQAR
ncbi:MAG UNVERIFIED_CONTAM: hypothetical protein LVT10_21310 [Anaerolineae bacterium]|jgi:phosphate transport system permease protein